MHENMVTSLTSQSPPVKWILVERFRVELDITESGSVCTLKVKGKLVCGEPVNRFQDAFMSALSSGHIFLIFDLEAVPLIDSSGIGSVVNALRTSTKAGGNVKLVKPATFVSKMLKMVGVLDLFEVFDSEADAAAACENS
jgi:anti-anti-sigma factor